MKFTLDTLETGTDEFLSDDHTSQFASNPHYDEVYIRWKRLFAKADAGKLKALRSVCSVHIWCGTTRAAVNSIVQLPNLRALHLRSISGAGRLDGSRTAQALEEFSCQWGVSSNDLLQIAQLPAVRKLTAHRARITEESLAALLGNPSLTELDLEDTRFSDDFARMVSHSKAIKALELGATAITSVGLQAICTMSQLRWLDIWSTDIDEHDLKFLSQLPNLEYLSIGGHEDQTTFTAAGTLAALYELPSLKTVWLDGLHVTKQELAKLNERFEKVWVSTVLDS